MYFFIIALQLHVLKNKPLYFIQKTKSSQQRSIVIFFKKNQQKFWTKIDCLDLLLEKLYFCQLVVISTNFYSLNIDIELRKCTVNPFHLNVFICTLLQTYLEQARKGFRPLSAMQGILWEFFVEFFGNCQITFLKVNWLFTFSKSADCLHC